MLPWARAKTFASFPDDLRFPPWRIYRASYTISRFRKRFFRMAQQKLVVGNWKLNGSLAANEALLGAIGPVAGVDVAVCVPFPYLAQAASRLRGLALGA